MVVFSFSVYNRCFIGGTSKICVLNVGMVFACYRVMWVPVAY